MEHPLLHSLALILLVLFASPLHSAEPPAPRFELQPYRTRISLAFADSPNLDSELRQLILTELPAISDRVLGEMWSVTAEENSWLLPSSSDKLAGLTPELLPADWKSESHDKAYLITVEEVGGEYLLSGREWDQIGAQLGQMASRRIALRRDLGQSIFTLAHDLFRPLLMVDRVVSGVASVTIRAGGLTPADPASAQMKTGQFWQPFLRYRNSKGEVDKLQAIPWTMLQVEEIQADNTAHGSVRVVSGMRAALPSKRRARVEVLARALEPEAKSTELRLVSRKDPDHPLVGVVVDARTKPDAPSQRYLTDRNGMVHIPIHPDSPLVWLYVRSGQKTLARLPVAPGLLPQLQAELPDDSIRLRVEGELEILESNLTDTVAQRAVLIARIRKQVQFNDWKSVTQLTRELRQLPSTDFYLKELTAIRVPAIQAAQAAKDKSAASYIDRVCDETSKVIQKFLDDDKLRSFEEELRELQKAPPVKANPPAKKT